MWMINSTDLEYTIDGYQYRTYLEVEDDNQKLFHFCFKDESKWICLIIALIPRSPEMSSVNT